MVLKTNPKLKTGPLGKHLILKEGWHQYTDPDWAKWSREEYHEEVAKLNKAELAALELDTRNKIDEMVKNIQELQNLKKLPPPDDVIIDAPEAKIFSILNQELANDLDDLVSKDDIQWVDQHNLHPRLVPLQRYFKTQDDGEAFFKVTKDKLVPQKPLVLKGSHRDFNNSIVDFLRKWTKIKGAIPDSHFHSWPEWHAKAAEVIKKRVHKQLLDTRRNKLRQLFNIMLEETIPKNEEERSSLS